ncbi:alpha/beta hydrolase [Terricaulis silvestris]|uniref:Monoterpene epsilon-lactone hydrolase n=1 Tax=Terricaulis silvestris TaxID=2686094 RepID=A0A6I6MH76_9CAUL|nr:alpha/beta hydrolase [Terricaulis silvestris]QGZ93729.1 Monoterpene epsilon-lactone hydrolase [Terricaulis silvestris]
MQSARTPDHVVIHPLDSADAPIAAYAREATKAAKGAKLGAEARGQYDAFLSTVSPPEGVTFEDGAVGGVRGVWARPTNAPADETMLYLHGGWFTLGSAQAYRLLVGQIATRAGVSAFIPDYRLAPEHPFPAAVEDVLSCFRALGAQGMRRIVLAGDSAGGNLTLAVAARVAKEKNGADAKLVAAVAFSPVTDLTLSGASYETRAEADPLFTRAQVADLVKSYLGGSDPKNPMASPLQADLSGLPPLRIHVGDDEVLLDDALRFGARAAAAGVDARVDVWMGLGHGFILNVGKLRAANASLDAAGAFIAEKRRGGA